MRMMKTVLVGLVAVSVAAMAWAVTAQELEPVAQDLHGDYVRLEDRVEACPGGACSEATAILDERDLLHGKLDQLEADRATIVNCGCQSLDDLIASIVVIDDAVFATTETWDQEQ